MVITDYETGRSLSDVSITLSRNEAEEMMAFLARLLHKPEIKRVYISEVNGCHLEREITLSLDHTAVLHLERAA